MEGVRMGIDRKTHRLREETMARKRNQEYHKQLFWNDIKNYYKLWELQANKLTTWASQPQTPENSERRRELEEREKENLQKRRARLGSLLAEEQRLLDLELKKINESQKRIRSPYQGIPDEELDSVNLEAMLKDQEKQRYENSIKKYHQIKSSHPVLRTIEKKLSQESVKKCLVEQIKEKEQQKNDEKELMEKLEEENDRQRKLAAEKDAELARKYQEEMKQLKNDLLNQMQEVKKRDELTQDLKKQEQQEMKLKSELERIAIQRNQIEKQRKKRELHSFLRHQYQLKLKQRTKEIQAELKEDKRLIDEITECVEREEAENLKFQENARKEIDRANAMLAEYTRLEKQREREMEFIFFEEAKKMWQKQEVHWSAEQEARNNLMRDVLVTIQKQVKEKLQKNAERHELLNDEKEELLRSIEDLDRRLKSNEVEASLKKKEYMDELKQQIEEKENKNTNLKAEERLEFLQEQEKLKEEEERILEELRKLNNPRVTGPTLSKTKFSDLLEDQWLIEDDTNAFLLSLCLRRRISNCSRS